MEQAVRRPSASRVAWHRSLYGRIVLGFLGIISLFLIAQGALLLWINARAARAVPQGATRVIATGLSHRLADNPSLNLAEYVKRVKPSVFVIMRDGRVEGVRRPKEGTIQGVIADLRRGSVASTWEQSRFRAVPLVVNGEAVGVVGYSAPTAFEQYGWIAISIDGVVLAICALIAAMLLAGPVRRRLTHLQDAARRLGAGDFSARAPEDGGDEVTELSRAFNGMADELSKREVALEEANRARRQLLADVSHELMTPLTAVIGHLETLQMPEVRLDEERRLRSLAVAQREARRLEHVVGDLLDAARLEAGGGNLDIQEVSIAALFEHIVARHEHESRARNIRLVSSVEPADLGVTGDAFRLEQALQNVTVNALRHTPDGGRVELRGLLEAGAVVLTVRDSGEGISAEHLPLIFDRFYKAKSTQSMASRGSGSGLGLSIVKAIVLRHGGSVAASSVVGEGTTITLRVPGACTVALLPDAPQLARVG